MNPSSKSLTSGSRKESRLTGKESGNRYDGTNPVYMFRRFYYVIAFLKYYDVIAVCTCAVHCSDHKVFLVLICRVCLDLLPWLEQLFWIKGPNASSSNPGEHLVAEQGSFKKSWPVLPGFRYEFWNENWNGRTTKERQGKVQMKKLVIKGGWVTILVVFLFFAPN